MRNSKGFAMGPPPTTPGRAVFASRNQSDSPGPIYDVSHVSRASTPGGRFSPMPRFESPGRWFGMKIAKAANYGMHSPGPIYDPPSDFSSKRHTKATPARVPDRFNGGHVARSSSPGPIYALPKFGTGLTPISFGSGPRFPPHSLFHSRKLSKRANYGIHSPGPVYEPYSDFGPVPPVPKTKSMDHVRALSPGPADARFVPPRNWCTSPAELARRRMAQKEKRPGTAPVQHSPLRHSVSATTVARPTSVQGSVSTSRLVTLFDTPCHSPIRTSASRSALFPYLNALPKKKVQGKKAAFRRLQRGRSRKPLGISRAAKPVRAPGSLPLGVTEMP